MSVDFEHGKLDVLAQVVLEEYSVASVQLLLTLITGFQLFLRQLWDASCAACRFDVLDTWDSTVGDEGLLLCIVQVALLIVRTKCLLNQVNLELYDFVSAVICLMLQVSQLLLNVFKVLLLSGLDVVVEEALHDLIPLTRWHLALLVLLEDVVKVLIQELAVARLEALLIGVPVVLDRVVTAAQQLDGHIRPVIRDSLLHQVEQPLFLYVPNISLQEWI